MPKVDLKVTSIAINSSTDAIEVSIANVGDLDLSSSLDGSLHIYFNDEASPSDVEAGYAAADWTYSFSTLSDHTFRTADASGASSTVVSPQKLSAGDDGTPIGSIYAYIDYGNRIEESNETNNDAYWRASDSFSVFHGIDDGPTNGTVSTATDPDLTYPKAKDAKQNFITALGTASINTIDFESTQGWGYGNFAGTPNDYTNSAVDPSVASYVSSPYNTSGHGSSQDASGSIKYIGTSEDIEVRFDLINTNGTWSTDPSMDDPGIGRIDSSNDFDRSISTTENTNQFTDGQWLEFLSTESNGETGQMVLNFEYPVSAVGFYLIGREDSKNEVTLKLEMADGSSQIPSITYPIVPTGDESITSTDNNLRDGSIQYIGFKSGDGATSGDLIQRIIIEEIYTHPFSRDIIGIDDISYVVAPDEYKTSTYKFDIDGQLAATGIEPLWEVIDLDPKENDGSFSIIENGISKDSAIDPGGIQQISVSELFDENNSKIDRPIREGETITHKIKTNNIKSGTKIYWNMSGDSFDADNTTLEALGGYETVDENGYLSWSHELTKDDKYHGAREIKIELYSDESKQNKVATDFTFKVMDPALKENISELDSNTNTYIPKHVQNMEYSLEHIRDYDGNLHANSNDSSDEVKNSYKYQGFIDVNHDGRKEAIYTNKENGRWVTATVDPLTGEIDYSDHGSVGTTRVVGIYEDPLINQGKENNGFLADGVTPAPANFGVSDEERYVTVRGERIDRLALNSQVRFQNDLEIDNLIAKTSGDYDSDGIQEVYWKTNDNTAYLRALMHADGNIRYANYQSEAQMSDYLTSKGYESVISDII